MERHVLVKLTKAVKENFTTIDGQKNIGMPYFRQSVTGKIEKQVHIFNHETDMTMFKTLYASGQIYVISNLFMEEEFLETESLTQNQQ